ncbi:hypothetical protein M885DRAFT_493655 [Pelagophyceae sp. CCMP2097]|nr:hypothetical protein M885DRAFT_493655 [Pelagophyceae sp. CCMP2097]
MKINDFAPQQLADMARAFADAAAADASAGAASVDAAPAADAADADTKAAADGGADADTKATAGDVSVATRRELFDAIATAAMEKLETFESATLLKLAGAFISAKMPATQLLSAVVAAAPKAVAKEAVEKSRGEKSSKKSRFHRPVPAQPRDARASLFARQMAAARDPDKYEIYKRRESDLDLDMTEIYKDLGDIR